MEAALSTARSENDTFAATRRFGRGAISSATASADDPSENTLIFFDQTCSELRETEFQLTAPSAAWVLLAADFTSWERFPLDMNRNRDGVWSIAVLLLPGIYTYRFIIDGMWCNDPRAKLYARNPFGTLDAVLEVT